MALQKIDSTVAENIERSVAEEFMSWEEHQEELSRQSSFVDDEEYGIGKIKRCIENMQQKIAEYETLLNVKGVGSEAQKTGFINVRRARLSLKSAISEFADEHSL